MLKFKAGPAGGNNYINRMLSIADGFTLLELIVSLVLLGLLTAIFSMGLVTAMQSNVFSRTNVRLTQKGQLAMARITRELMELTDVIATSQGSTGEDPFIIFDRMVSGNNQGTLRFCLHLNRSEGILRLYSNLDKTVTRIDQVTSNQGDALVDGVGTFSLTYFMDGTNPWNIGAKLELLSTIQVQLDLIRPDSPDRAHNFMTLVHLRNTNNFGGAAITTHPPTRDDYSCFITTASRP